ncbi:MAG: hypothetical protein ACOYOK_16260 [Pseudobdellovibrionaceae bacterium]
MNTPVFDDWIGIYRFSLKGFHEKSAALGLLTALYKKEIQEQTSAQDSTEMDPAFAFLSKKAKEQMLEKIQSQGISPRLQAAIKGIDDPVLKFNEQPGFWGNWLNNFGGYDYAQGGEALVQIKETTVRKFLTKRMFRSGIGMELTLSTRFCRHS